MRGIIFTVSGKRRNNKIQGSILGSCGCLREDHFDIGFRPSVNTGLNTGTCVE